MGRLYSIPHIKERAESGIQSVALLDRAVIQVLTDRRHLTPDLGGTGTTTTVADEVLAQVRRGSGR